MRARDVSANVRKLHLGCGRRYLKGYFHVDVEWPAPGAAVDANNEWIVDTGDYLIGGMRGDAADLGDFRDESVDLIYACQLLQYWDREQIEDAVLPEWRRVLKRGTGWLRLSVPDFAVLARLYGAGLGLDDWLLGTLYGRKELRDGGTIYHRTTFDVAGLEALLRRHGFADVQRWDPWAVLPADYDDYSKAELPRVPGRRGVLWNLNLEARRVR